MKSYWLATSCLVLSLLASCGKKEHEDKGNNDISTQPTEAEVSFYAQKEMRRAVVEDDLPALRRVLMENSFINLNEILFDGETYLTLAIKYNFNQIRNFLIEKGADVNKANINKETPLMVAIAKGRSNSVRVLLDLKVDLNKKNAEGDTALIVAIKNLDEDSANLLINQGASLTIPDKLDRSPLRIAEENQMTRIAELIQTYLKVEVGAPDLASYRSVLGQADYTMVKKLNQLFPTLLKSYDNCNPLSILVDSRDENKAILTAEYLLNENLSDIDGPKDAEITPLIKSTVLKKQKFVDLYLSHNANPHLWDKDGKSALIHAIELNSLPLVKSLIKFSAAEKYTFRKDGKKVTISACATAKEMAKKLRSSEEKEINSKIQGELDCGFLSWLF
ncbi:ankyrin repeat domain-containing protein [Peredibacter starrii]|uniref:Ankyrin repeat domain-containing protein n=1 Tax=Peredibacter starrii TaxID=28202 RepID=A0AAX4HJ46_9BACT|nr:ankyrin repeat domain-containing protein [Peredibacter starrii]WPU63251.1 ankyrin repeat domain-containing protein [Peredibacter starrii]